MSAEEVAEFGAHPNAEEAVTVRRWDDNAKEPSAPVLPVADVLAAYGRLHA
jgi:predicted HD phosphohydrolase